MEDQDSGPSTQQGLVERLKGLMQITRALTSTLALRPLLQRIVRSARDLTETEAASILLLDRGTGYLYFEAFADARRYRAGTFDLPLENVAGEAVRTGEPVVVQNPCSGSCYAGLVDGYCGLDVREILTVPMSARGTVLGVLRAVNKRGGTPFTDEGIELLATLGDQAAVAVQNAQLFQESDLVAEFMHEVRMPLRSIMSHADLIQRAGVITAQCE